MLFLVQVKKGWKNYSVAKNLQQYCHPKYYNILWYPTCCKVLHILQYCILYKVRSYMTFEIEFPLYFLKDKSYIKSADLCLTSACLHAHSDYFISEMPKYMQNQILSGTPAPESTRDQCRRLLFST